MKIKPLLLIVLSVIVVGIGVYLLVSIPEKSDDEDVDNAAGGGGGAASNVGRRPLIERVRPRPGYKPPVAPKAPAKASAPAPEEPAVTKEEPPAKTRKTEPSSKELALEAKKRELVYYQTGVANATERIEKLKAVLARLERSSEGTPEARTQIQAQLQHFVDTLPRLKERMQTLEKELASEEKKGP
jgi:hypothetical protein